MSQCYSSDASHRLYSALFSFAVTHAVVCSVNHALWLYSKLIHSVVSIKICDTYLRSTNCAEKLFLKRFRNNRTNRFIFLSIHYTIHSPEYDKSLQVILFWLMMQLINEKLGGLYNVSVCHVHFSNDWEGTTLTVKYDCLYMNTYIHTHIYMLVCADVAHLLKIIMYHIVKKMLSLVLTKQ